MVWPVLRPQEREPVYQGKGLRVWLAEYYYATLGQGGERRAIAASGIRHIGTNAIPTLLNMLRKKDSPVVSTLIVLWERHIIFSHYNLPGWVRLPSWYRTKAMVLNAQASMGFEVLRADARQAVPALIEIYDQHISAMSGFYAGRALIAIGPDAVRKAIPSFVRGAASSDAGVRQYAVWTLVDLHAEPSLLVPALVKALSDTNASIRRTAAMSLKEVGFAARPAVPALVLSLNDPDAQVRGLAAQALMRIDYDAAVKAGVK
jgi:hypothetical protein